MSKVASQGLSTVYNLVTTGVRTRGWRFSLKKEGLPMPPNAIRVSLRHEGKDWVEVAEGRPFQAAPTRTTFLHCAAKWGASAFFEHIDLPRDLPDFVKDIQDGHVIGCGDGSFQPDLSLQLSSSAWKMMSLRSGDSVSCAYLTTGPGAGSHRAESQGPYLMALFLAILSEMFPIS